MITIDGRDGVPQETANHENAVDDDEIAPPARVSATAQVQAVTALATEAVLLAPEPSTSLTISRELCALRRDAGLVQPFTAATPEEHSTRHGI